MELVHAGWPTHPAWDGLRVGREGKGVGVWLDSSVKMMRRMKLLGGFGVGVTARPGQSCWWYALGTLAPTPREEV